MKWLVFLVEEQSMKAALDKLVPRLLEQENVKDEFYHQVLPHKGKTTALVVCQHCFDW